MGSADVVVTEESEHEIRANECHGDGRVPAVGVRLQVRVAVGRRVVHECIQHSVPTGRRANLEEQHKRAEERLEVEGVVDAIRVLHLSK